MWIAFYVGIGVLGLAVLAGVAYRLFRQVRQLARDVKAAGERIAAASEELARETATRSRQA
ncbi:MAG: hypothetical protein ACTHK4_07065 [Mycobacteriales bacterium]